MFHHSYFICRVQFLFLDYFLLSSIVEPLTMFLTTLTQLWKKQLQWMILIFSEDFLPWLLGFVWFWFVLLWLWAFVWFLFVCLFCFGGFGWVFLFVCFKKLFLVWVAKTWNFLSKKIIFFLQSTFCFDAEHEIILNKGSHFDLVQSRSRNEIHLGHLIFV